MPSTDIQQIRFHYLNTSFNFSSRTKLKFFLLERIRKEGFSVEALNYIFCDDEYLLSINRQYLNHDTYTDIITFQLNDKGQPLISDIYISVDRVKENAEAFGASFKRELHRVIFHGALHLCGYKDKTSAQVKQMREKEEHYLKLYFRST